MSLTNEEWVNALRDGDIVGVTCTDCSATYGTPFVVCNKCGSRDLERASLPTEGKVYSETRVQVAPVAFDRPYQVGIVQLDDVRVMAHLEDNVSIGDCVVFDGVIEASGDAAPLFCAK